MFEGFRIWHLIAPIALVLSGIAAWYDLREEVHLTHQDIDTLTEKVNRLSVSVFGLEEQLSEFVAEDNYREGINAQINSLVNNLSDRHVGQDH